MNDCFHSVTEIVEEILFSLQLEANFVNGLNNSFNTQKEILKFRIIKSV